MRYLSEADAETSMTPVNSAPGDSKQAPGTILVTLFPCQLRLGFDCSFRWMETPLMVFGGEYLDGVGVYVTPARNSTRIRGDWLRADRITVMERQKGRKHCSILCAWPYMYSLLSSKQSCKDSSPDRDSDLHLVRVRIEVGSVRH